MGGPCIECGRHTDPLAVCEGCGHDPRPPEVAASIADARAKAKQIRDRAKARRAAEKNARDGRKGAA